VLPDADEEALTQAAKQENPDLKAEQLVSLLAKAKAESVLSNAATHGALVLGGDSALEFQGEILGKPHEPEVAIKRWQNLSGNHGVLHSGHYLVDNRFRAIRLELQWSAQQRYFSQSSQTRRSTTTSQPVNL
jgi:septum formation protein